MAPNERVFGRESKNRLSEAAAPGLEGAQAALETFYFSFNNRSIETLRQVWRNDGFIQLNNPLGGIIRGIEGITGLYDRVFNGPARVWVEFYDIMEYISGDMAVFAGRERGEFSKGGVVIPLAIRTTRVFKYTQDSGWRQVHHHGSIDDAKLLDEYQKAVRG
ncbi:MAG: nuclear transport factor 2 family protein [Nitrospinae bacterium]|nr:nuclear transport factor 2 family protein [Nitrospinota bacterium]